MWTIGREREKEHAHGYLGPTENPAHIDAVIDAVYDLKEGAEVTSQVFQVFRVGFIDGGRATWDQTGTWLRKVGSEFPSLLELWHEFATHRSSKIRFRAAAFLNQMPPNIFERLFPHLLDDISAKVRSKTAEDRYDSLTPEIISLLKNRQKIETNNEVRKSIEFALNYKAK